MPELLNFNGAILRSDAAILTADNRSFRYGDGLFETIRVKNGQICLESYHFDRLMAGIRLIQLTTPPFFTPAYLTKQILSLCEKNGHSQLARIRLVVFRSAGGFGVKVATEEPDAHFVIQSWPLASGINAFDTNGLVIDLFPSGRKACDPFANLKSNNYLLYVMAALYARDHHLDDCLVLNSHGRIADSSIANLFYCSKDGEIFTPPLSEGCVGGVMRRFLLDFLPKAGFTVREKETTVEDLEDAEAVFLSNALRGIQWVRSFRRAVYDAQVPIAIQKAMVDM
jgi:branched-chain amino acid aminotransferase